jgi:FSR family fosmidomycin resistance protein-like MFS transporter
VYGIAHFAVDMACAAILFTVLSRGIFKAEITAYLFLTYNLLAFGLQVFIGFLADMFKAPRAAAMAGLIITGMAAVMLPFPIAAIVLAGIGNAFFHVGGGVISLNLTPQKATAPGIFVAPGALGLMAGTLLGKNGDFSAWPFLLALAGLVIAVLMVKKPEMYRETQRQPVRQGAGAEIIIYLVLFVIAVRSLIGFTVQFPWKSGTELLVLLTMAAALGKGLGGFLADRFGWTRVAVCSLIVSIPLLNLGTGIPALGMAGIFLFNITMPVTLAMVSNVLPGRPGTAFGLCCMALVFGTLPVFAGSNAVLGNAVFTDIIIAASTVTLFFALRYYYGKQDAIRKLPELIPEKD